MRKVHRLRESPDDERPTTAGDLTCDIQGGYTARMSLPFGPRPTTPGGFFSSIRLLKRPWARSYASPRGGLA